MFSWLKKCLPSASENHAEPSETYGPLEKQLTSGDYSFSGFFPYLEGRFIQVNKNLELVDQSADPKVTTIALAVIKGASPTLTIIFAEDDGTSEEELKPTRLYPVNLLNLTMDGATCTLEVAVPWKGFLYYHLLVPEEDPDLLDRWIRVLSILED